MYRKELLANDCYYHVLNRSIAKFIIFNNGFEYERMSKALAYYTHKDIPVRFSRFESYIKPKHSLSNDSKIVEIICYCLMPTHIHLILKQKEENGISDFMKKLTGSYSKFFNLKHKRKGPLWESNFKAIRISSDEQLQHLTRYIHLNPVSAGIIESPKKWKYSSYLDFIEKSSEHAICKLPEEIDMTPKQYELFTKERIKDQRALSIIKSKLLENYSG